MVHIPLNNFKSGFLVFIVTKLDFNTCIFWTKKKGILSRLNWKKKFKCWGEFNLPRKNSYLLWEDWLRIKLLLTFWALSFLILGGMELKGWIQALQLWTNLWSQPLKLELRMWSSEWLTEADSMLFIASWRCMLKTYGRNFWRRWLMEIICLLQVMSSTIWVALTNEKLMENK